MNYRHAYHAGNFADVLKHTVLALVIEHLKRKDTPFRVIDTHAGAGMYDLRAEVAEKTQEWRDGIGRLLGAEANAIPDECRATLAPYLDAVRAANRIRGLRRYPGSPWIVRHLLRPGDRLVANDLHPQDGAQLAALFVRDRQAKVLKLDGWTMLKAVLPPRERRGVVLIDPPFEEPGEFERIAQGLAAAVRRFATGTYVLWFPIKSTAPVTDFYRRLTAMSLPKLLKLELLVHEPRDPERLNGTGVAMLNPPYRLEEQMRTILPFLAGRLAQGPGARHHMGWLSGEALPGKGKAARR